MAGHVYLIGSNVFHWYKIGKSNDATIRVSELGILLPFRVEVIAVWKVHDHHQAEKILHEKYDKHRINGEWFNFHHNQIRELLIGMTNGTLLEGWAAVQTRCAQGFSNLQNDSIENMLKVRRHIPVPKIEKKKSHYDANGKRVRGERGGKAARIDAFMKEIAILQARVLELENMLDNKDLPVV